MSDIAKRLRKCANSYSTELTAADLEEAACRIEELKAERDDWKHLQESFEKKLNEYIDKAKQREQAPPERMSEHYGLYGARCIRLGHFDAGLCWKCQIKKLEAKLVTCNEIREMNLKDCREAEATIQRVRDLPRFDLDWDDRHGFTKSYNSNGDYVDADELHKELENTE